MPAGRGGDPPPFSPHGWGDMTTENLSERKRVCDRSRGALQDGYCGERLVVRKKVVVPKTPPLSREGAGLKDLLERQSAVAGPTCGISGSARSLLAIIFEPVWGRKTG